MSASLLSPTWPPNISPSSREISSETAGQGLNRSPLGIPQGNTFPSNVTFYRWSNVTFYRRFCRCITVTHPSRMSLARCLTHCWGKNSRKGVGSRKWLPPGHAPPTPTPWLIHPRVPLVTRPGNAVGLPFPPRPHFKKNITLMNARTRSQSPLQPTEVNSTARPCNT